MVYGLALSSRGWDCYGPAYMLCSVNWPLRSVLSTARPFATLSFLAWSCTPSTAAPPAATSNAAVNSPSDPPSHSTASSVPTACNTALLCDDFEHHSLGEAPGAPFSDATGDSGARVSISSERSYSGSQSVHIEAKTGKSYRRGYFALHGAPVFPAASQEMYGRAMVWLNAAPITPAGAPPVHWTLLQGEGRSANDQYNAIYRLGGQHQQGSGLMANFETTPPTKTDCWQHSATRMPVRQWACVEWHFVVDTNEMEMWIDSQALSDLHIVNGQAGEGSGCLGHDLQDQWLAPPAFNSLYLGWERYQQPTNDRDVWFDDVAVSLQRIGCPGAPD